MSFQVTVDQSHVVIFHGPRWCGTQGLFQITHRALIISQAGLHFTQAVSGDIVHGTQIDCLLQGLFCFLIVLEPKMSFTQFGKVPGVVRVVLGQGAQRSNHLLPGTPDFINPRQYLVCFFIGRVQFQRFISRLDGAVVMFVIGIDHTQVAESAHMFGILLHCPLEQLLRSSVVPFARLLDSLVVGSSGVSGHQIIF